MKSQRSHWSYFNSSWVSRKALISWQSIQDTSLKRLKVSGLPIISGFLWWPWTCVSIFLSINPVYFDIFQFNTNWWWAVDGLNLKCKMYFKFSIYRKTVLKYLRVDCSYNSTIKSLIWPWLIGCFMQSCPVFADLRIQSQALKDYSMLRLCLQKSRT